MKRIAAARRAEAGVQIMTKLVNAAGRPKASAACRNSRRGLLAAS